MKTRMLFLLSSTLLFIFSISSCRQQSKISSDVVVASWGGQFQEDLVKYWIAPAAHSAALNLHAEAWNGDYGALATRIRRGLPTWDLVHVEAQFVANTDAKLLFRPIPSDTHSSLAPQIANKAPLKSGLALPVLEYGVVLAYQKQAIAAKPSNEPLGWPTFWNIAEYPGGRGLRDSPIGNIEVALLSMGHNPVTYLYNEKSRAQLQQRVTEALDRLSQLRGAIVWWSTGDQLQRGLVDGTMVMAAAWSGRVLSANRELRGTSSAPDKIGVVKQNALVSTDWWVVPSTAPHPKAAIALLQAMYSKQGAGMAEIFSRHQGYAVPFAISFQESSHDTPPIVEIGSHQNLDGIAIDERFWSENYDWILKQWQKWQASIDW